MRLASLLLLAACPALLPAGELLAGAGKREITPPLAPGKPVYIAGFGENRVATGVLDPLWARCAAMSTSARPVVLCGVDSIGLFRAEVLRIRARVRELAGRDAHVIVAATHSHQTPDTMGMWGPKPGVSGVDESYNAFVVEQTARAAAEAIATLRPASAMIAHKEPRDARSWFDDSRPPVVNDPAVTGIVLLDLRRERLATIVHWTNHPEALGSRNTKLSADYVARIYKELDGNEGGVTVFLNGALGGMQSPLGAKFNDPLTGQPPAKDSPRFAEVVADAALQALRAATEEAPRQTVLDTVEYRETLIKVPVTNPKFLAAAQAGVFKSNQSMLASGALETSVGYLKLGAGGMTLLEAAMVPGELYPELAVGGIRRDPNSDFPNAAQEKPLKSMMSAQVRVVVGLANDEIGYIIPKLQWDEKPPFTFGASKPWYGEVNAAGPDAAPALEKAFLELVKGN
jgi:hypothetical protein